MSASSSAAAAVEQRILHFLSTAAEEAVPYERLKREVNLGMGGGEGVIRQLMEQNRVRLRRGTGGDTQIYISIVNNINEAYSLVLEAVRESGESGIDQAQLLSKVRMPKTELGKALTALASKNLIKEHRSFTNRAKRIYTLFHIDPSAHVTGGTMYCGEELDVAFVDEWRRELARFVSTRRMVGFDQIKRHVEAVQSAAGTTASGVDSVRGAVGSGHGSSGLGGSLASGTAGSSPMTPPIVTMIDASTARLASPGSAAAFASAAAGGTPANLHGAAAAAPGAAAGSVMQPMGKQLTETDLRTLVHTLVLDGVLEMVIPTSQEEINAPQYRVACGQSVMRHFTVQAKLRQRGSLSSISGGGGVDGPARQRVRRESATTALGALDALSSPPHDTAFYSSGLDTASAAAGGGQPRRHSLPDIEHDGFGTVMDTLRQSSVWEPAAVSRHSARGAVDGWAYMPAIGFPCLGCPQLERCSVSGRGVVNPTTCVYLKDWLS